MADSLHRRFPTLTVLLSLSGWAILFFSNHSKLISTATAAVGAVIWGILVGVTTKIWVRVEKTIVDLIGNALDTYIRDFASRYRKRYFQHLQHRHRTFDVKGLSTQGIYALEIEQVYVELTVDPTQADKASRNPIAKAVGGQHDIWTFLTSPKMQRQDFAILGAPGSGKTTLLKHIALGLAANRGRLRGLKRLPVLLFIRDHAAAIGSNPKQTIADVAEGAAERMHIPAPTGWFAREFHRGHCLVMLDGLDEVADDRLRKTVAEWVERQLQAFGANRFLVTSRPFGYRSNPLSQVSVLEVRPFNSEQGERFIANWYMANEVMSAQRNDEGVNIAAREGAADLLKRIRDNPALAELAVNPLLLTMIANVHRFRSSLPGRRVELYAEICEVFLGKRQQARGMELDLTPAQKKRVLQPLAFHMMCTEKRTISLPEAVHTIGRPLALVNPNMRGEEFLQMVENSSGLILEPENGFYSFAHFTFQEYLAASHIVDEKVEKALATRVAIPWWHEVIRLYVALADATRIVEMCISGGGAGVTTMALAVECLEEARAVRPDLRSKVESIVFEDMENPDADRARLAAETKLALRLRRLTRIDNDHYTDNELISCAEYQLFIDDRRAAGGYHQPDHWRESNFPVGSALNPVLGVRRSDAEEFCRWLTERQGGEWTYQIPDKDLGDWPHEHAGYWAKTAIGPTLDRTSNATQGLTREMLSKRFSEDSKTVRAFSPLAHAFDLALDRDLDRDRIRSIARALAADLAIDSGRATGLVRDLIFDLDRDLDHVLNRVPDGVLDLDRTLDLSRALARALDRALALDLALDRGPALDRALNRAISRLRLLAEISSMEIHPSRKVRWYTRLLPGGNTRSLRTSVLISDLFGLYLDLANLEERAECNLPAFEGIRITKVRKAAGSP